MASPGSNLDTTAHHNTPGDSSKNAVEMNALDTETGSREGSKDAATSSSATPAHRDMSQSAGPSMEAAPAQESTIASIPAAGTSAETTAFTDPSATAPGSTSERTTTTSAAPAVLSRLDSVAIGPSTDADDDPTLSNHETGPVCVITLILHSGARHPYTLDEKYLNKRKVDVPEVTDSGKKDPFSISVYTLKELILREWRAEWEAQPSSPSSIRLIHFGKFLEDNKSLRESAFKSDVPNVLHIAVKPQEVVDDEEASKAKAQARNGDGGERTAGCKCVIL